MSNREKPYDLKTNRKKYKKKETWNQEKRKTTAKVFATAGLLVGGGGGLENKNNFTGEVKSVSGSVTMSVFHFPCVKSHQWL